MTNHEKKNIYNAIQNLYNMDFKTWQEVLSMIYNLVADVNQKFDTFESKFESSLGYEVTYGIKKLYDDGKLNEIINAELLNEINDTVKEINDKVIEFRDGLYEQLNKKTNELEVIKATKGELEVERNRINILTKIQNEETEGNTELLDIRIGANGKEYSTAGENVRDISNGTGLMDNSIFYSKLSKEIQDNFLMEKDEIKLTYKTGGYWVYNTGSFIESSDNLYNYIEGFEVKQGDIYIISGSASWQSNLFIIKNQSGHIIDVFPNTMESKKDYSNIIFTIPYGACKIYINSISLNPTKIYKLTGLKINHNKIDAYKQGSVGLSTLDPKISNSFIGEYSKYNVVWNNGGYYQYTTGKLMEYEGSSYSKIEVKKDEKFKITGTSYWESNLYIIVDKFNNILSAFPNISETTTVYTDIEFIIPKDGAYLLINQKDDNTLTSLYKITSYKLKEEKKLKGINWTAFGDSLTDEVSLKGDYNYVEFIADSLGLKYTNCGKGGTGYLNGNGGNSQFYNRTNLIPSNTDILTVFGSFNDLYVKNYTVGTIHDTDTNTLYGAIKKFIQNCWAINPDMIIGIISPTPWEGWWRGHSDESRVKKCVEYVQVLKTVAEFYSLPFLDLFSCSNLRPWDLYIKQKYYLNGDGVHPNSLGHKTYIAPKIEHFILFLISIYNGGCKNG